MFGCQSLDTPLRLSVEGLSRVHRSGSNPLFLLWLRVQGLGFRVDTLMGVYEIIPYWGRS